MVWLSWCRIILQKFIKKQWIFVLQAFEGSIQKISFYHIPAHNSAASVSRPIKDFGIFHGKAALEKGASALFYALIILRKKKNEKSERKLYFVFKIFCI